MSANLSDELRRDRCTALRLYSASLMSNTKWRAVFLTLRSDDLAIRQIVAKFIDVPGAKPMGLPSLNAPLAFVNSVEFGPFPLIGIEWIEVPATAIFPRERHLPPKRFAQDTTAVRAALIALGKQLSLEDTATGLRVVGHVR